MVPPDNLYWIMIIFISIPFITMIVVTIGAALVYIVDYYRETLATAVRQVVTELWKKVRK